MSQFAPPGHRPGRKGHRVLRRLAEGRANTFELMEAAGVRDESADGRRFGWMLSAMRRDGLIGSGKPVGLHHITAEGRETLAKLDAGQTVITTPTAAPSVRVFAKESADA